MLIKLALTQGAHAMQRVLEADLTSLTALDEAIQNLREKTYYAWTHGEPTPKLELWQDAEPYINREEVI